MARRKKKGKIAVIIILSVLILAAEGICIFVFNTPAYVDSAKEKTGITNPLTGEQVETLPARPLIVSTDNVGEAKPQLGISKADIVYEVPVEGSQSRLEAIYYSEIPETVGPCRSVRSYIVDLAREYNAILVHNGYSPQAREYLEQGSVAYIPAQKYSFFYRTDAKPAPHDCLVDTKDVLKAAADNGWDTSVDVRAFSFMDEQEEAVLTGTQDKYLAKCEEEIKENLKWSWQKYELPDLSGIEFAANEEVSEIKVTYSGSDNVYKYLSDEGVYQKFVNGGEYADFTDGELIKTSNLIVYRVSSSVFDHKGRLDIDMCAGGEAWVFTKGRMFECTWSKKNLDSPTVFKDKDGNEIKLAAGNTWINIIDGNSKFSYK